MKYRAGSTASHGSEEPMLDAGVNSCKLVFEEYLHCHLKTLGSDGLGDKYNSSMKEKSSLSKLFYAVAQSINFTHLISLQIKLYCHLLHFMLHKPLLQSILLCPIKILLSSPCLKFAVLLFSPPPCQQLGWPQMEHIWQLKWPRCWIWSHLPSCSSWAHVRLLSCWLSSCPRAVPSVHPKALTKVGKML